MHGSLEHLRKEIETKQVNYFLITNPTNIFYFSGFKGVSGNEREALLLVGYSKLTLITSRIYRKEAEMLIKDNSIDDVVIPKSGGFLDQLEKLMKDNSVVGVEKEDIKLSEYLKLKKNGNIKIKHITGLVETLRMIKGPKELTKIKKAVKMTDKVMGRVSKALKIGISERDISRLARDESECFGAERIAFETIVASGKNSAFPHYVTGQKNIEKGVVLIDLGVKYKGYCGDLTRTYYLGKPEKKFIETYKNVDEVLSFILEEVKPGVACNYLWELAIKKFGNKSKYFLHSLGHGVGLSVHEKPSLSKNDNTILKPGMVITIEPGLYFENWGGIRIEEYLVITDNGVKVLSKSPRKTTQVML